MSNVIKWHQFLLGASDSNREPNFIIQYYCPYHIPFLQGKMKKFYLGEDENNLGIVEGVLVSDTFDDYNDIGTYALYIENTEELVNFYGMYSDKDNITNATKLATLDKYIGIDEESDINHDMSLLLPNNIKHLKGIISYAKKIRLFDLPDHLETIGTGALMYIRSEGLGIPNTVYELGLIFGSADDSVLIDNLYFTNSIPPKLIDNKLGTDYNINNSNLQICIPMEYKDNYLNSGFKVYENILNVNRLIKNPTNIGITTAGHQIVHEGYIGLSNDIKGIVVYSHSKYNNTICLNLPYSINSIDFQMKTERFKTTASNKIIINSDIENVKKGRTSDSLFKDYGHVEFSEHCTYIPELLIDTIFSYGKQRSGLATNNLIYTQILTVGENIKDIYTTFKYGSSYGDDSNNTAGVMVFFKGGLKQIANMNFHKPLVDGTYNTKQVLVSYSLEEPNYNADLIFTIPQSLDFRNQNITKINDFAFYNIYFRSTSRFSIYLPKELTYIGEKSLYFSDYQKSSISVDDVYYFGTIDDWFKVETKGDMFGIDGNIYDTLYFAVKSSNNVSYPDINNGFIVSENVEIFNKNLNGYKSLSSITINSKIINANTLDKCNNLRSITLGTNVSEIKGQFTGKNNISCTYLGTINDYYKIKGFDLHLGRMLSTKDNENNDTFSVIFDNTITEIDNRLQYKSSGTSLIISESIETIHEYAFNSWSPSYIAIYADIINQFKSTTLKYNSIQYLNLGINITNITNIFKDCANLTSITYNGTIEQWNAITKAEDWNENIPVTIVTCSDGTVTIRENN